MTSIDGLLAIRQSERKTMREEKPDFEWGADRSEDDVMA